jgi:glycosyltransferase involved in cell wall biosynthesis
MPQKPRVSIIIPMYNGVNYMRQAIDSALNQTWPSTEVIVVNDGSNDGGETDRIARSYGDRIRYVEKRNGGVASALNAGLDVMDGDVFCWLSHDDLHVSTKTEQQVARWTALGRPGDVVLYSDYTMIDAGGAHIADVVFDHEMLEQKPLYSVLRGSIHGCSVFVPHHLFEKAGKFDTRRPTTQDYDLWFRMTKYARFVHMPDFLVKSRWHDEQGSKKIDHIAETNAFWSGLLEQVSEREQEGLEGSVYRFQKEMEAFLHKNGICEAADRAAQLAEAGIERTLVSIVIPVYNRHDQAISAVDSALAQTHTEIEVIVVDDGSTDDTALFRQALAERPKVRLLSQENLGPAAARNLGWRHARGRYVAFLDSDDLFLPNKIASQIRLMAGENCCFSHTSYWRHESRASRLEARHTGLFGGQNAFPEIIGGCAIATPTVMVRRDLWEDGLKFPQDIRIGEDILLWIRIAARCGVQGIDRPLTIVRSGASSAAYDPRKQVIGLENIIASIETDPKLSLYTAQLARLREYSDHYRNLHCGKVYDRALA